MTTDRTTGIAGEELRTGDVLMRGPDGRYYRAAAPSPQAGAAAGSIRKGQIMESVDGGPWRQAHQVPTDETR